jgi:hypothetical protein
LSSSSNVFRKLSELAFFGKFLIKRSLPASCDVDRHHEVCRSRPFYVNPKMVLVRVTVLVTLNLVIAVAGNGMHVVEGILVPLPPLPPSQMVSPFLWL